MSLALLVDGIGELVTNDPSFGEGPLGIVTKACLVAENGRVVFVGPADRAPPADKRIAAHGRCVLPGFVDSHTHLVFAGDRSEEFEARMSGIPYSAGGINSTVASTRAASDGELSDVAARLVNEALRQGTTTLETKSGYGLTVDDEERSLRVAADVSDEVTFLGAHVVPIEYSDDPAAYVALVAGEMLERCASLAKWCDVYCEKGAFDADAAREILAAGADKGLGLRVHANQLGYGPGARLAAESGATSADHVTYLDNNDIAALLDANVVATLIPAAEFSTRSRYADGRALADAGVTVALASGCNPGTSYTTSIPFAIALAVRECGLSVDEAIGAATSGGARALLRDDVGTLSPGKRADLVILDAPSRVHLAYRPGVDLVATVIRGGEVAFQSPARKDAGRG
ncbi:MAG TPA: imidazolonepropionase [Acidimicrobiales bacterium]|nr:imidazolonepropionase [Acidimicrobiales bacterium]